MAYSQSSSSTVEHDLVGPPICHCGLRAPRRVSWSDLNPGRRFFGCANYKVKNCGFFMWYDHQEMSTRATDVILNLRDTCNALRTENYNQKMMNMEVNKNIRRDLEIEGGHDGWSLKCEIEDLRGKLNLCMEEAKQNAKMKKMYMLGLLLTWTVVLYVVF